MVDVLEESEEERCWMKEIVDFLLDSILPGDKIKVQRIRMKVAKFAIFRAYYLRNPSLDPY